MTALFLDALLDAHTAPLVRCTGEAWQQLPLAQLVAWLQLALDSSDPRADVFCLATTGLDGAPNQRFLSFRGLCSQGLCFFSSYTGVKASELERDPRAAMVFFWPSERRQLRLRGAVQRLPAAVSDVYFRSRPLGSRRTAVLSRQSHELPSNFSASAVSAPQVAAAQASLEQRPETWGGYALWPDELEFWQGGKDRWHDRVQWSGVPENAAAQQRWRRRALYP